MAETDCGAPGGAESAQSHGEVHQTKVVETKRNRVLDTVGMGMAVGFSNGSRYTASWNRLVPTHDSMMAILAMRYSSSA
jgi:hypothetical protein